MRIFIHIILLMCCQWAHAKTLLVPQLGHSAPINHLTYSPSGRFLASSSEDNTVRVWAMDGNIVSLLEGHKASVVQSAFLSDKYLLSISRDGVAYGWNILSQRKAKVADLNGIVPILAKDVIGLAKSNSHLAIAGYRSFHWTKLADSWAADTELALKEVRVNFDVEAVAISPSGRFVAAANKMGYLYLYDTVKQAEVYRAILEPVFTSAAFINDEYLALGGRGVSVFSTERKSIVNTIAKTDFAAIEAIAVNPVDGAISAVAEKLQSFDAVSKSLTLTRDGVASATVAYSPDGKNLAIVDEDSENCYAEGTQIRILDAQGDELSKFAPGLNASPKTALAADDILAISACSKQVQLWDLKSRTLAQSVTGLGTTIENMTFDAAGEQLLFMGSDGSLHSWHQGEGASDVQKIWGGLNLAKVAFSSAAGLVAYKQSDERDIQQVFIDSINGQRQRVPLPKTFTANIDAIKFSPSGAMLTVQTEHDGILAFDAYFQVPKANDLTGGTPTLGRFGSFGSRIVDYRFNPVNGRVVIAYEDRLELWSSQSFTKMNLASAKYTGIKNIYFSNDGKKFALSASRKLVLFNAEDLTVIDTLEGVIAADVYFTSNDKHLVVVTGDAQIDLYDIENDLKRVAKIQSINDKYGYALDEDGSLSSVVKADVFQPILRKRYTEDDMTFEYVIQRSDKEKEVSSADEQN